MTTEQLNKILKHIYDKDSASIVLSTGKYIHINPQISCPYIEDNLLHLEGDYFAWIEVKDIIAVFNTNKYVED